MLTQTLKTIFQRDLLKLKQEIELYKRQENIWIIDKNISNAAGNLCLHLVGNLNTFIGANLGNSGYIRNRELEFSLKDIPASQLVKMVEDTIQVVNKTLNELTDQQLEQYYPIVVLQEKTSVGFLLVHLAAHLSYHLGQINYHRRLLDN